MNLPFSSSPLQRFGWLGVMCGAVLCIVAYMLGLVESGGYFNEAALYAFRNEYSGHWYKVIGRLGAWITVIAAVPVVFGPHLARAFRWAAAGTAQPQQPASKPIVSQPRRTDAHSLETLRFQNAKAAIEYARAYLEINLVPGRTLPGAVEMVKLDATGGRGYTVALPTPAGVIQVLVAAREPREKYAVGDLVAVEIDDTVPTLTGAVIARLALEYHVRHGWKQQIR
ncbi:hypothetical protein B7759_02101 [Burkholderia glumae]|uniref:hypothetical protein n=1 Tax=Burkholderia glumae TaxID=337 RepID=UPI001AE4EBC8|nr:hypothetical protein [Burkholderia glumae]QTP33507.1 hypothetical protein B7759_02101 [Burkholderia glumae]